MTLKKRTISQPVVSPGGYLRLRLQNSVRRLFQPQKRLVITLDKPDDDVNTRIIKTFKNNMRFAAVGLVLALIPPLAIASVPVLLYSSRWIIGVGLRDLLKGKPTAETLVSLVVLASLGYQLYAFSALAALVSQYAYILVARVQDRTKESMVDIFQQRPRSVWVVVNGEELLHDIETVREGDTIAVHTGEVVPIDGVIVSGLASVDQHILTGEAQPVEKENGDEVFASTVVMSGSIWVRVVQTGDDTVVAQIGKILNQTISFKAARQLQAEEWTNRTVTPTLLATAAVFPLLGTAGAISVLYAHPKHRMTLFAPITILNYFRILSDYGILVKDGRTLDMLAQVDTVVFDKTGTLTETQPTVGTITTYSYLSENEVLALASTAERHQSHPIAHAIREAASQRQLSDYQTEHTDYKVGYGIIVMVDGQKVRVGSSRFMELENLEMPLSLYAQQERCHINGHSLVLVAVDDTVVGAIELMPTIRAEASQVIESLHELGIKETYIISGDHEMPTRKLAHSLGIDHYYAQVLPQDKANIIQELQDAGKTVCYIGDGINDSIALKQAAVSVSLSGASNIAVDTAQVIMMHGDLEQLPLLLHYGHEYDQNLRNVFTGVTSPMLIALVALPFPTVNLVAAFASSIVGLSAGFVWSMMPILRYRYQKQTSQPALPQHSHKKLESPTRAK